MNTLTSICISRSKILLANKITKNVQRFSSTGRLVSVIEDEKTRTANLVLQKAPVNSLNLEFLQEITSAIKNLEKKRFRGCVISSGMPTIFSAGLDIMEMYQPEEQRLREFWRSLQEMFKTLYQTPLVTIAAINGHAPAGGCMIALSCDYRIMTNGKGTIGMNEVHLGITAPRWFQSILIRNIGMREAEKALLMGTLFPPEKALSLGMIDELASDGDDLKAKAQNQMSLLVKLPALAFQTTKIGLRKPVVDELISYQEKEIDMISKLVKIDAVQGALGKYIEQLKAKRS